MGQNVKEMAEKKANSGGLKGKNRALASNVKKSRKYERFGETIRYMTWEEWQLFLGIIDNYRHKLMMQMIYELGCRVGEFVTHLLQLKNLTGCFASTYESRKV